MHEWMEWLSHYYLWMWILCLASHIVNENLKNYTKFTSQLIFNRKLLLLLHSVI